MRPMRRLWPTLIALLGLTLLAAAPASAAVAASIENRASGLQSGSNNLVGTELRLSEEAVRKKVALAYDLASDDAVAARGGLVIGRGADLAKPGALRAGEYALKWDSKLPNFKAEWAENAGRLREVMRQGNPIRDASVGNTGGIFLNAERALLKDRGWTFHSPSGYWMPPGP